MVRFKILVLLCLRFSNQKPEEFGVKGDRWNTEGWLVKVLYQRLSSGIAIKDIINELEPHIPEKYSPISHDGRGMERYLLQFLLEWQKYLYLILITTEIYSF